MFPRHRLVMNCVLSSHEKEPLRVQLTQNPSQIYIATGYLYALLLHVPLLVINGRVTAKEWSTKPPQDRYLQSSVPKRGSHFQPNCGSHCECPQSDRQAAASTRSKEQRTDQSQFNCTIAIPPRPEDIGITINITQTGQKKSKQENRWPPNIRFRFPFHPSPSPSHVVLHHTPVAQYTINL
ncbi:hypothetical protein VTK26DRAFT_5395 [Humicola hyalothermophila]